MAQREHRHAHLADDSALLLNRCQLLDNFCARALGLDFKDRVFPTVMFTDARAIAAAILDLMFCISTKISQEAAARIGAPRIAWPGDLYALWWPSLFATVTP